MAWVWPMHRNLLAKSTTDAQLGRSTGRTSARTRTAKRSMVAKALWTCTLRSNTMAETRLIERSLPGRSLLRTWRVIFVKSSTKSTSTCPLALLVKPRKSSDLLARLSTKFYNRFMNVSRVDKIANPMWKVAWLKVTKLATSKRGLMSLSQISSVRKMEVLKASILNKSTTSNLTAQLIAMAIPTCPTDNSQMWIWPTHSRQHRVICRLTSRWQTACSKRQNICDLIFQTFKIGGTGWHELRL